MELKYCERCGILLGYVRPNRKYCAKCKDIVHKENKKAYDKKRTEPTQTVCAYCGKPMVRTAANQKYHKACAYPAQIEKMRALNVVYSSARKENKAKALQEEATKPKNVKPKSVLSVAEVQALADKLHLSYAKVSYMLSAGKIDPGEVL